MRTPFILIIALAVSLFSCKSGNKEANNGPDEMATHIDSTVRPGNDFFLFANGKWFKNNPIPASEQSNGLWQLIQDTINDQVKRICVTAAAITDAPAGSNKQKIGDFYFSGMDSVTINKQGLSDIKPDLDRISAISDLGGIVEAAAHIHAVAGAPLFSFGVTQDDRISSKYAVAIYQGGLSLPNRDFYFDKDARAADIRKKFEGHLSNMFALLGYNEAAAKKAAGEMVRLETELAAVSRKPEDTRDPLKNYNKLEIARLKALTPDLDWTRFFGQSGLKAVDSVIVGQPEFLSSLNTLLKKYPIETWKDYLKYHFVRGLARYLDDKTYLESFSFYSTTLRGIPEPKPRWKRVVQETNSSLGELIGQIYVDEYLPKGTKEKLVEIGNAVKAAYAERIKALDWMSDATKTRALKKLDGLIIKAGYPDKWKDLSALKVDRKSYVQNVINASLWWNNYSMSKYGKPVDRTEWSMDPQTYNAYYNPSNNEIVVPGCNILVPGYEHRLADDAILYSIIGGSTFGHEMTHGFDDQGCKYDENGNLTNWWTADDSIRFYAKTKMIIEQFDNYIAVDSLHINGELTQGENIADLGGLLMGYDAFRKTEQYKNNEKIAGLTPDQRFFLGYAQAWMINDRPEAVASQVRFDVHSPAKFRVIGPLSNIPEFYAAFGVKQGDAMWRPDSLLVRIW